MRPPLRLSESLVLTASSNSSNLAFIEQVGRLIWGGSVAGWHEGNHLAEATARAGLDLAELDRQIEPSAEAERLDALIAANQDAQREGGHYGVPLMVFEGEPFFGQDRFDQLQWRMEQKGLARR